MREEPYLGEQKRAKVIRSWLMGGRGSRGNNGARDVSILKWFW